MKAIFESVIDRGSFKLEDMIVRIETFAANGRLTFEEMNDLIAMARKKANAIDGMDVGRTIIDLSLRVAAIEKRLAENDREMSGAQEDNAVRLYPEYIVGTPTIAGDKWSWKGKNYTVIDAAPEKPCVWSPEGYPAYWQIDEEQPE